MSTCTYVRRVADEFEYGHMRINHSGEKKETREYIVRGTRPTMEAALKANDMALKGYPRLGHSSGSR
jgi:hypothetical protein